MRAIFLAVLALALSGCSTTLTVETGGAVRTKGLGPNVTAAVVRPVTRATQAFTCPNGVAAERRDVRVKKPKRSSQPADVKAEAEWICR